MSGYKNAYTPNAIPKRKESRSSPEILFASINNPSEQQCHPTASTQVVKTLVTKSVQWVKITAEFK